MTLKERIARALCQRKIDATDESWQRYRQPDSWKLFAEDAQAALEAMISEGLADNLADAATWETAYGDFTREDVKEAWLAIIKAAIAER